MKEPSPRLPERCFWHDETNAEESPFTGCWSNLRTPQFEGTKVIEYLSLEEHSAILSASQAREQKLREALEQFLLGHEHATGLEHIRVLGDTYGWCDFCQEKVGFGPGIAEQALSERET